MNNFVIDEMIKAYDMKLAILKGRKKNPLSRLDKKRAAMRSAVEAMKIEGRRW